MKIDDKETQQAWQGWQIFIKATTITTVISAAILLLMALFLT